MEKKHEYAIGELKKMAKVFRASIKAFPTYTLVPIWKKNLKDVERAIRILKVDREKAK